MVIYYFVDVIVFFLQGDLVFYCFEVVVKVYLFGGLNSRKDLFVLFYGYFFGQCEYICFIGFGVIKMGNFYQKLGFGQFGSYSIGKFKLGRLVVVCIFVVDLNNIEL